MTKLKSLTATLAATALVSGIGLAYAQSTDSTSSTQSAPAAADSQYNANNSAMNSDSTTNTAPADTSTTAPADTSSTAPADTSSSASTDFSNNADTTTADSMDERAPQADRN
jgi:hypothetical protein